MQQIRKHRQGHILPFCYSFFETAGVVHISVQSPCTLQVKEWRRPGCGLSLFPCRREGKQAEEAAANGFAAIRVPGEASRRGTHPSVPVQQYVNPMIKSCTVTDKHLRLGSEHHFQSKEILGEQGFPNDHLFYIVHFNELLLAEMIWSHLAGEYVF